MDAMRFDRAIRRGKPCEFCHFDLSYQVARFTDLEAAVRYLLVRKEGEVWHESGIFALSMEDVAVIEARNRGSHLHAWTDLTAEDAHRLAYGRLAAAEQVAGNNR